MKCIRFVSIIIVVLMMSLTCFGSEKLSYNDEIKVYINNNEINLDMYPFIEDNRTMVPMRGFGSLVQTLIGRRTIKQL